MTTRRHSQAYACCRHDPGRRGGLAPSNPAGRNPPPTATPCGERLRYDIAGREVNHPGSAVPEFGRVDWIARATGPLHAGDCLAAGARGVDSPVQVARVAQWPLWRRPAASARCSSPASVSVPRAGVRRVVFVLVGLHILPREQWPALSLPTLQVES